VNVVSPVLHGTLQIDSGGAYTYTLDNDDPDTQALAQGETATDVFLYTITDAYGATATATLTIVITGTNDAPVILNGPVTAEFTEAEDETGGESAWSTEGSFGYKDVDISDNNHEVSVAVAATETIEGLNLSNAELLELFNASLTQTGVAGTTADITWEFSAADSLFDYLAEGEDLVLTYTLTLADDYDATDTRTVTITVTGTNDAPVILGEPVSIDFTEAEGQTFALVDYGDSPESPEAFQPAYQTGGTLSFEDVDVSDNNHTLAIAVQTGGDSDGLSLCQQELLELLTTTLNQTGVTGTLGSIDWNFAAPDDAFEYLAEGEELTLTYTLTLTDDEGASTLQTVTVTITGTNDAPVIADTSDTAGSVTESGALAGIEDAGPDGGLEPTITLTNEVTTGLGGLSSNPEDVSTVLATIQSQLNVDLATAITIVWDYLDDAYVSAGPDQININEAFVRLGVEYVEYLQNGGMPLIGVTAKYTADGTDEGDAPDRVQSLHDNLLGNLTDDALTQRFGTDAPLHAELTALVTATDPELLTRPYYGGYEGSSDEDVRDWDANHDYDAPTATGQLAASDVDNGASLTWSAATTAGTYGTFAIDASTGKWTYQLDDSLAATQALATGETDIETFTVTVTDEYGATDTIDVTITVNGTNDAAAEEPSGTVTVTVETDEGYNIEELYDQLFNSDVLQISASHIKLQHTSESLYFWITTENLVWSPVNWGQEQQEQEDITLLDGIITGIEIFSDGNLQEPVASFDGFNIDAAELQEAIDIYDGVEGETSGDTSALDAIFDAYSYDMTGGAGPDTLTGADQNDTIEGSGGDDVLTGDLGADRFIFGEDDGEDTITDFNINDDTIVFVSEFGTVSYETFLDDQDFETWAEDNLHDVAATQDTPAGVEIEIGDGQTIFLENVQSQQLTRGHFDFVGS
jgi:VCBS repeat-containing protein